MYILVLKVRHNPELVDLFLIEPLDECLGHVVDVLTRGDRTTDHEDIHTCL